MRREACQASSEDKGKQPLHLVCRPGRRREDDSLVTQLKNIAQENRKHQTLGVWATVILGVCAYVALGL